MQITGNNIGALLGGAFMIGIGCLARYRQKKLRERGTRVEAIVVDIHEYRADGYGKMYRPIVKFETGNSETITKITGAGTNPCAYHINQKVPVIYDPQNPDAFIIDNGAQRNLAVLFIIGGIAIDAGLIIYLFSSN